MIDEHGMILDHRVRDAVSEIKHLIRSRFPSATFTVGEGEEPPGIYLHVVVDVDDTDEVTEVFIGRLIDLQVEEGLRLYVIPVPTPERQAARRTRFQEAASAALVSPS